MAQRRVPSLLDHEALVEMSAVRRSDAVGASSVLASHPLLGLQRTAGNGAAAQWARSQQEPAIVQRREADTDDKAAGASDENVVLTEKALRHWNNVVKLANAARFKAAIALQQGYEDAHRALRKLRARLPGLHKQIRNGGGPTAKRLLDQLQADIKAAEQALAEEKAAVAEANKLVQQEAQAIKSGGWVGRTVGEIKRKVALFVGGWATKFAALLAKSPIGRALLRFGRIIAHPAVGKALTALGAALAAWEAYRTSPARTTAGKVTNAGLAAGGTVLVMSHPATLAADVLAPKGYKPSQHFGGTAAGVTAIGEGIATGDTAAMEDFHGRSKAGEYGVVMKAASEAGDFWAEKGVVGGLEEFADALGDALFD